MGYLQHHKHPERTRESSNSSSHELQSRSEEDTETLWRPWESIHSIRCPLEECHTTFKRESELKRHHTSIHDRNIESCPKCPQTFTRKDNLTRHLKSKHRLPDRKPPCEYCNKILSRRDAVQRHVKTCAKNPYRSTPAESSQNVKVDLPNSKNED